MNEPYNAIFQHSLLPKEKQSENVYMFKWLKNDGDFVNENEEIYILRIGEYEGYYCLPTQPIKSSKAGILEIKKVKDDIINSNDIIYNIHFDDSYTKKLEAIEKQKKIEEEINILESLINTPIIDIDAFTNNKNILWEYIGGDWSSAIKTRSQDNKIQFYFSFNHINDKNYIIFLTKPNQLVLSKDDEISFLFEDNKIINFVVNENSYKSTKQIYIISSDKIFESKILITNEELKIFQSEKFLKWKIHISKNDISHIGGEVYIGDNSVDSPNYQTKVHQQLVINKLASDFEEILLKEKPEFIGLNNRDVLFEKNELIQSDECYVYLMIDLTNNFHKIGISNSPKYREFTLQSEKPTIELLASKKFINRKIAKSFENALHSTYTDKRLRGEWFKLDEAEIDEIVYTLNN
ncbi:MAG: GIY-YIG nuclease family protein [Lutibacter sp.]|nr:GIY-YIG nuclease family protein [Lutibacter sp.]